MPVKQYNTLGGKVGRRLVRSLRDNLRGVRVHKWNTEHFIVF